MPQLDGIDTFCTELMRGVAASGVLHHDNLDRAVQIIRDEAKAFFWGDDYADERAAIIDRSVSPSTVMASVVASCVLKLNAESTP